MRAPLRLLADLLAAIADAHTARVMARAIATHFSSSISLTRLELTIGDTRTAVELADGGWHGVESEASPDLVELVPGLAIATQHALADHFRDPDFLSALAEIIASATRHLDVVHRLAQLSRRAHVENRELRADVDRLAGSSTLVARSPAMRAMVSRLALVARHPTTVLLTGESGTGKEIVARELHRLSPRGRRAMLQINCGAIPEALVESELFGHERGAFTGADRAHAGVFERAHRSTLFLDEIGDLPLPAQAKLLRVLQERQIRRVGGSAQLAVDVRLVAATNRPLAAMVRAGSFREDLYYRLDVFALAIPPLRERREDLGPLVAALVGELAHKLAMASPPITRRLLEQLHTHDWPGNVRELANLLESALILGGGHSLELPAQFLARTPPATMPRFDAAIRVAIEAALRTTHGKIYGSDGAASQLGLKPGTLQSKMRKLGIDRAAFTR